MSPPSMPIPLKIEHSLKDRLYWNFLNLIPFLIGSIAIARDSFMWVAVYTGIALFFFLTIEFRFACTHCLHYIRSKGCVKCMMLPGIPKLFKARSGPHNPFEKAMVVLGALPVFLFPVYWLVRDPLLLGAYIIAWALFFLTAQRYECVRCINFECPVNRIPAGVKQAHEKKGALSGNVKLPGEKLRMSGSGGCISLKMKHEFKDFLYWNFVTLILLFSAGLAIGIYSTGWLLVYVFLVFFHFDILEQRFFCTHCPYYATGGIKQRCMMSWGWPKHFKPRPYPPGKFDLAITTLGFLIVIFFPISWLLKEPFLMGTYSVSILIFLLTIWKYECSHCIYFGCPFNRVPAEIRRKFEKKLLSDFQ
ncbi:hypothetical protein EQO05_07905 [Methanosarcina sp. MSH10X1]|uniref:hypothetical protein n=1 Tax=Methanosarcina sp. MSH10X1 TaxID=2507075 RepID=UPI000FFB5784|nr:hypothetical protein [Methanosarcina sp. MSH10X1]RXA19760.1 hypothetical protein EQO05_07905 [Methanosarcina sp. MSH10X1]